jgi:hypothetical protein
VPVRRHQVISFSDVEWFNVTQPNQHGLKELWSIIRPAREYKRIVAQL